MFSPTQRPGSLVGFRMDGVDHLRLEHFIHQRVQQSREASFAGGLFDLLLTDTNRHPGHQFPKAVGLLVQVMKGSSAGRRLF